MVINKNELKQILPELIKNDDAIRGAIIAALEGVIATKDDIKLVIKEMDKRFEAVDKRFEELIASMNKRFEAVDKRFEAVDKRFEELIASMNKRFEAVDKRFVFVINELKEVKVALGSLGGRSGINLEKTILEILREVLVKRNIDVSRIESRKIKDWDGEIFQRGTPVQLDVLGEDGDRVFIEIKFHVTTEDVMLFDKKSEFLAKKIGEPSQRLMIALEIDDNAKDLAEDYGMVVITKRNN
ncbi:MAG: DUF3782 domain-containing protein [Candidatus Hodarchaeales archaeon]